MRCFTLLLAATFLQACTTLRERPIAPQPLRGEARVTLDGRILNLQSPTISGDSLFGERYGQRVAVPLTGIRRLQVREVDEAMTIVAIAGTGVAIGGLVMLMVWADQWEEGWDKWAGR